MIVKRKKLSGSRPIRSPSARPVVGCPIVGIGASAGGLEAFTQLLKQLPLDTGFGFVLVQHLDPQHESALAHLLARATLMPVHEVTDNLRVEANHVYIIPPNANLSIAKGVLNLQPRAAGRVALRSIDFFFEALAADQHERTIGVILSGTATDGTLGLEAIKAEGGLTFAQNDSAKYDSMPRNAVAAGCVDLVLSPDEIARELARIAKHPFVAGRVPEVPAPQAGNQADGDAALEARRAAGQARAARSSAAAREVSRDESGYKKVLHLLRNHCGVDFSLYKPATVLRRITRRSVLNRRDSLATYAEFLRGNPGELDALYSDALINVTSFFRDADAFAVLQKKVFPKLLKQRSEEPVRIWALGCSTGQEAYSLAMAFAEVADRFPRARKLQVFATDLNDANLEKARHGLYPRSVAQDVSPERLRRFFVEEDGGHRIVKSMRERIVFARQNLISDPPFSRMDLISCRNLMIYLEPGLQKKALPTFHYALNPGGFLFLGASESVGTFGNLFEPVNKKQKIFSKKAAPAAALPLPVRTDRGYRHSPGQGPRATGPEAKGVPDPADLFRTDFDPQREADRVTVNQFAPPGVLVNAELQILQFRGPTGAFLEPPTGKASFDLLKMARPGLMLPLRSALHRARKENRAVRSEHVMVGQNGDTRAVTIEVVPLKNLKELCFLVMFEDADRRGRPATPPAADPDVARTAHPASIKEESSRISELERDLIEARDYLQSLQEQHEAANEELQASNEEAQSANEELQSLNEELETSKEELESTNEELTTVNEEMVNRNTELNRLNSDLTNLQTSTRLIILVVGRDLTIRRFSAQAEKYFALNTSDVGRAVSAIRHNLSLSDLGGLIAEVILSVRECEREVQDKDGHWYSLRVRPYLTVENKVDGAVLVLVDITDLKRTEQLIIEEHDHAEAIIRTVPNPLVILSADLHLQSANDAFYRSFKVGRSNAQGRSIFQLDHGAWDIPRLRRFLRGIIPTKSAVNDFEITHNFARVGRRSLLLNARILNEPGRKPKQVLLSIQDITDVLTFQTDLRRSEMRYRRLFEAAKDGILILDPVTRKITDANPFIVKLLGYSRKQLLKKELWQIGLLKDEAANQEAFRELKARGFIRYEDLPLKSKDGRLLEVEFVSNLYDEDGDEVIQCNIRDITERKQSENALVASEGRFRALFELGPVGVYSCDAKGWIQEFNRCAARYWGRKPRLGDASERFCGSFRMYLPNGRLMPHHLCPMAQVLAGQLRSARDQEVIIERPDHSRITVVVNIVPLKNDRGEITGAINCFYDITERKRAEQALASARAELAEHAAQLEGLVATRTAQLTATNRRLKGSVVSIRKGREKVQSLLGESQEMQKKLRQLTHLIISAQEEERKKISRELHDDIVQTLVGINVELTALVHGNATGVHVLKDKIAHTQRLVENSVEAIHRFARELRPAVLDDLGLIPALHTFCKNLAARKKLKIKMTAFGGVERLDADKRTVLFRVAQEALTNIARHARATKAVVNIRRDTGLISMEISDNGQSFPVEKVLGAKGNKRLGLVGMKERVEMVGGRLDIKSSPGKGTTVRAEIPFTQEKLKK